MELLATARSRGLHGRAVRRFMKVGAPTPSATTTPAPRPFLFYRDRFIYIDLVRRYRRDRLSVIARE